MSASGSVHKLFLAVIVMNSGSMKKGGSLYFAFIFPAILHLYFASRTMACLRPALSCGCFHGRTFDVTSMSCGFGPLVPGHLKVDFQAINGLKKTLKVIYLFDSAKHMLFFV